MLGARVASSGPTSGRRTTRSAPRPRPAATCASTSTTPRCRPRPRSSRSPRTRRSTSTPTPTPAPHDDVLVIGAGTGNDVAVALRQGAQAGRRGGDRPGAGADRARPASGPALLRPAGDACTSTTGAPSWSAPTARYDLVLFALPDSATIVTGQSALRLENYLFTTQALERARSLLQAGRHVRDVQLLRAVAARPLRQHDPHGLRHRALRAARPDPRPAPAGGAVAARRRRRPAAARPRGPHGVGELEPSVDDRPFPYLGTRTIPSFYLWMLGARAARLARAGAGGRRAAAADAAVHRPVLHGGRVPAARDQERRAVRPALRHHLGGERRRVRRRAAQRAGGDRGGPAGAHRPAAAAVCRAARRAGRWPGWCRATCCSTCRRCRGSSPG